MQLNHFKNNALIQLINCKEKWTVKSISDLFDGKLFCDIIQEVFPETYELLEKEGQIVFNYEEQSKGEEISIKADVASEDQGIAQKDEKNENTVIKGAVQKSDTGLTESAVHDSESILATILTSESIPEQVKSPARVKKIVSKSTKSIVVHGATISDPVESAVNSESFTKPSEKNISNRYRLIKYFIDVRYNLKSETVINFSECLKKNELELAKVLIFIMSEVIRLYVFSDDPLIQTLSHVDSTVQKNLEQCLNFFISERKKITKGAVEKILTSASNKISSSPNNICSSTPRRSCASKYKRLSPTTTPESQESVYTNSPLKTLFESPVFTKADIVSKDKEILKIRQILFEEESNSYSLEQKMQVLEKKLEEKDKEIKDFKKRNRMLQENEKSEDCKNCAKLKKTIEDNQRRIRELEVDIKERNEETRIKFEDKFFNYQLEVVDCIQEYRANITGAEKEMTEVMNELNKIKQEKSELEETIRKLLEDLDEKNKELEVYKEKVSYTDMEIKKESESSVLGECMGKYFQGENDKSSFDASHIKLEMPVEEKSMNNVMVQCPEQKGNTEPEVSKSELSVPNNLPDCENIQNSKKFPENAEKESPNACDASAKQESRSKQLICSSPKETSVAGDNYPTVVKEGVGSLWHKYDNTISENESGNNNNYRSVTSDGIGFVWQNNNFITETENADGDNSLTKALNILHKTEYDLNQMSKHLCTVSKVSPGPNGSNGLGPFTLREFLEGLKKSVHKSVLCLSQAQETQMKCQNNNSISKKTILEVGHNSEGVAFLKCFECSKVGKDSSDSTKETIVNQESSALLEKTQELLMLKDKYKMALKTFNLKEKELENCKKKFYLVRDRYQESLRNTKGIELKYKKLENDLKEAVKRENDFKMECKRHKFIQKTKMREMYAEYVKFQDCLKNVTELTEENKRLKSEIFLHTSQNEKLSSQVKHLEKELENGKVSKYDLPSTLNAVEKNKIVKGIKDRYAVSDNNTKLDDSDDISKLEFPLSNINEVTSQDTENESMISCALQQKSFQSSLHLHNYDEEEFLNHSSLAAIHSGYESTDRPDLSRVHELLRRNTLLPGHLRSHYAIENLPGTPIEKNLPNHKLKAVNPKLENNIHVGGKKRKVSEMEAQSQSSLFSTPLRKIKKKVKETPTSWKKLWEYRRNQRSGSIKPKP